MFMEYSVTYYIQVYKDGYQIPLMHLESNLITNFRELSHLARGHMSKSEGVMKELEGMELVLKGQKEVHTFGGDDWCVIDFKNDLSTVISGFDEFESFEIDSKVIYKLLQEWHEFLCFYENGEIPGLIPN